jgi:hypothetical protein
MDGPGPVRRAGPTGLVFFPTVIAFFSSHTILPIWQEKLDTILIAHGICATGNHIRCAASKLFSSSEVGLASKPPV